MGLSSLIMKWYNNLCKEDKLKVIEHFNKLVAKEGMILMDGEGTMYPTHDLPHKGSENSIKKRLREIKEKKILKKTRDVAITEMFLKHLKGEF